MDGPGIRGIFDTMHDAHAFTYPSDLVYDNGGAEAMSRGKGYTSSLVVLTIPMI